MCNCGGSAVPRDEYQVGVPTNHSNTPQQGIAWRLLIDGVAEDFPTEALAYAAMAERERGGSVFPVQVDREPVDA